jgi:hypothetical protein
MGGNGERRFLRSLFGRKKRRHVSYSRMFRRTPVPPGWQNPWVRAGPGGNGNGDGQDEVPARDAGRLSIRHGRGLLKLGGLAAGGVGVAMMLGECDVELVAGSNLLVVSAVLLAVAFLGDLLAPRA